MTPAPEDIDACIFDVFLPKSLFIASRLAFALTLALVFALAAGMVTSDVAAVIVTKAMPEHCGHSSPRPREISFWVVLFVIEPRTLSLPTSMGN
jgi:hypothetical protein